MQAPENEPLDRPGMSAVGVRVERGMSMLDEKFADWDWLQRVDLDRLDMGHGLCCIVAQVWGMPFYQVLSSMGIWNCMSPVEARIFMFNHGLDGAMDHDDNDYYRELTAAWRAAIEVRRGGEHGEGA